MSNVQNIQIVFRATSTATTFLLSQTYTSSKILCPSLRLQTPNFSKPLLENYLMNLPKLKAKQEQVCSCRNINKQILV